MLSKISEDLKQAMKSGDTLKKSVLRMLLSEIKYAQTATGAPLDDAATLKAIAGYHKKLTKSCEDFDGERLAAITAELNVIEQYLPKQKSQEEIIQVINEVLGTASSREFGPLIGQIMKKLGTADGKVVSQLLRARLEQ